MLRLLLFIALLLVAALPGRAQGSAHMEHAAGSDAVLPTVPGMDLGAATTLVALPWQRDLLGLSTDQFLRLRGLADHHLDMIHDIRGEVIALQEAVHTLHQPVNAREAYALFADIKAHEAEIRIMFSRAETAMLNVLTTEQRTAWIDLMEAQCLEYAAADSECTALATTTSTQQE